DFHVTGVQTCALPIYPVGGDEVDLHVVAVLGDEQVAGRVGGHVVDAAQGRLALRDEVGRVGDVQLLGRRVVSPHAVVALGGEVEIGRASCRETATVRW